MTYGEILEQVSREVDLPKAVINKVYMAYWKSIREHIESLPLKEDLTQEEFMKLQPNVNIQSLGKYYVTYDRFKNIKKYIKKSMENAAHNKD